MNTIINLTRLLTVTPYLILISGIIIELISTPHVTHGLQWARRLTAPVSCTLCAWLISIMITGIKTGRDDDSETAIIILALIWIYIAWQTNKQVYDWLKTDQRDRRLQRDTSAHPERLITLNTTINDKEKTTVLWDPVTRNVLMRTTFNTQDAKRKTK
jgi:hypothetical protein